MGKGSRVREDRTANNQTAEVGAVKLSKKQIIRLQEKKKRNKKIITWSISAVVAIAVVVAIILSVIPNIPDLEANMVAKNEHFEIDGAMFAYVVYDYVGQYGSYMASYGYDASKGLLNQSTSYTDPSTKQSMTWYAYFCGLAESKLAEYVSFASAAKAEGMTLSDDDKKEIDDYMKELKTYALKNGYGGVNKFLNNIYTPGVTEGAVRRYLEIEKYAYAYVEKYLDSLEYTPEEIEKYREENPGEFNKLDYLAYTFSETYAKDATDEQKAEAYAKAKAKAEEFLAQNKTLDEFKNAIYELEKAKESSSSNTAAGGTTEGTTTDPSATTDGTTDTSGVDGLADQVEVDKVKIIDKYTFTGKLYDETKAVADATKAYYEWAYSADRKAEDTYIQEVKASNGDLTYTVHIIVKPVYIDDYTSKDVQHILFDIDTSLASGSKAQEEAYAKAKEEAEKVLDEYNKGNKTSEAFGELAKEHTADSNGEDGGLYENVLKGAMVEEFENWIYDEARKEGDVELVKTKYGWHLMYFVGDGETAWKVTAEDSLKNDDYTDHLEELEETFELEYDYEAMFVTIGGKM